MINFETNLQIGKATELSVVMCPALNSFSLIPLTDLAMGGAPRLLGPRGEHKAHAVIVPDYGAYRNGQCFGLEIKGKGHADHTKITGELEHGIGLRLLQHYNEFERRTGHRVVLLIDEKQTGEVLAASLAKLQLGRWRDRRDGREWSRPRIYDGDEMDRGGMAFFARNQFKVLHQREAHDLPLFKGGSVPPTLPPVSDLERI